MKKLIILLIFIMLVGCMEIASKMEEEATFIGSFISTQPIVQDGLVYATEFNKQEGIVKFPVEGQYLMVVQISDTEGGEASMLIASEAMLDVEQTNEIKDEKLVNRKLHASLYLNQEVILYTYKVFKDKEDNIYFDVETSENIRPGSMASEQALTLSQTNIDEQGNKVKNSIRVDILNSAITSKIHWMEVRDGLEIVEKGSVLVNEIQPEIQIADLSNTCIVDIETIDNTHSLKILSLNSTFPIFVESKEGILIPKMITVVSPLI